LNYNTNIIPVKIKLEDGVDVPLYKTRGAACFDIAAKEDVEWKQVIHGFDGIYEAVVPTGIRVEIPSYAKIHLHPRSGNGFKYNVMLGNNTGIIDEDYRGEIFVKLIAFRVLSDLPAIKKGAAIAQGEVLPKYTAAFDVVQELSETERGENGIGSTGHL